MLAKSHIEDHTLNLKKMKVYKIKKKVKSFLKMSSKKIIFHFIHSLKKKST